MADIKWVPSDTEEGEYVAVPITESNASIDKRNLPRLEKRIARLQRKAEKYGLQPLSFEIVREWERPEKRPAYDPLTRSEVLVKTGRVIPMLEVKITGQTPTLEGGWRLIAVVDHRIEPHETLGYPVFSLPWIAEEGIDIPDHFHTDDPWCDHCELERNRAETFIILSDDGEWKRVGRNCLKDYTGGVPLHAYASHLYDLPSITFGLDEHEGGSSEWINTETYLGYVAAVIEEQGWKSRSNAEYENGRLEATADIALEHLEKGHHEIVSDANRQHAQDALAWVDELADSPDDLNDYEYNLVITASQSATRINRIGLVASLIHAYQQRERKHERLEQERKDSEHQGEVGKRYDLVLTVKHRIDYAVGSYSRYRGSDILYSHIRSDDDGNIFVWKTRSHKMAKGETYNVRGTVKEHGEYEGVAQTVLTRCKITHEPCGEDDYYFREGDEYICLACEKGAKE